MRFAIVATAAAAAIVTPWAVSVRAPQMSGAEFLSAVRCTAYQDIARSDAELAEAKWRLNGEAQLQPVETTAQARAEISAIAREAGNVRTVADADAFDRERAAACAGAQVAVGADSLGRA